MGLDNLDQNYYDPNFPGNNHPWGDNSNYENWRKQMEIKEYPYTPDECYENMLIEVPVGSLILTPNDTDIECRIKFNQWLDER